MSPELSILFPAAPRSAAKTAPARMELVPNPANNLKLKNQLNK